MTHPKKPCSGKGCRRLGIVKGMCKLHYARAKQGRPFDAPVTRRVHGPVEKKLKAHSRIDRETGCRVWIGARNAHGYGLMCISGQGPKKKLAHRAAWEEANGPIPEGKVVMHTCDNRACCNLDHLKLGTRAENSQDRSAKKRMKGCRESDLKKYKGWR